MKNFFLLSLLLSASSVFAVERPVCGSLRGGGAKVVASDVPYQQGARSQKLDVYAPTLGSAPYRTVLLIHGGCFQQPGKAAADTKEYIERLANSGYAVVSADYRLADPENKKNLYPASLLDVQDALRWIRVNGDKYGLRKDKVIAFGFSAGATLAAYLGTRSQAKASGVVDFFGRMDFLHSRKEEAHDRHGRDCGEEFVGETRGEKNLDKFLNADVLSGIESSAAPFLIVHGDKDSAVSVEHSRLLFAKLQEQVSRAKGLDQKVEIVGANHGFGGAGEMDQAWSSVCAFLEDIAGKKSK